MKINGHELTIQTDMIDVTMLMPYPDPSWRLVDSAGHEHHYSKDGPSYYPTLTKVIDVPPISYWCGDCHEQHEGEGQSHYECSQCGERIKPGMRSDTSRRYAPGRTTYLLDGESITKEQAMQLIRESGRA